MIPAVETNIPALFAPRSLAVVGASAAPGKIGHIILANLVAFGYPGKIVPVNPAGGSILGLEAVKTVAELPEGLDLAVVSVPPAKVVGVVRDLAAKKVRAAVIITAGFKEAGGEGLAMEREMAAIARNAGMALLGPNCLGCINTDPAVNATFAPDHPPAGRIGFFSQSGALCIAILDWAFGRGVGFSKFVSLGNKAVLDESHLLRFLADDPATSVIAGYLEGVEHGAAFLAAARYAAAKKPVILIKAGATTTGAKAAVSHTGALAGSDAAFEAACKQAGVIRVSSMETLFALAGAFAAAPPPRGANLAVVTNSGGPGILAADACERQGLTMASLHEATVAELKSFLPPFASAYNPVDIIGDGGAERYRRSIAAVLADSAVNSLLVILTPTPKVEIEDTARAVITLAAGTEKTVMCCFIGETRVARARAMLREAGVPCFDFPDQAVECLAQMYRYHLRHTGPPPVDVCYRRDEVRAAKFIEAAIARGQSELVEFEAQDILRAYEMPLAQTALARTSKEAAKAAGKIGYPVVVKVASPQISHKSDVGGVAVGLKNAAEVQEAFLNVTSRARSLRRDAHVLGCLVQQMAPKGSKEVIVGFTRDPQFGALIMFGLGGIYVEVLKDIAFRLAPLTLGDAQEMVREIRSFPLLRGVRGEPPVDLGAIEDVLLMVSQLAMDFPQIVEADFNPVLVGPKGAVVADARLGLCLTDAD
jgi:acetate---CoA ligase (ADP-forming)